MNGNYDDIINLPHHRSACHPHMPMIDRAAQFSPFAALTGYEAAVKETARLTDAKIVLTEEEKAVLDMELHEALDTKKTVRITYFVPDSKKTGGTYVDAVGQVKRLDAINGVIRLTDGTGISIGCVIDITVLP